MSPAPFCYWFRDLKENGTEFIYADGWRKSFRGVGADLVPDQPAADLVVNELLSRVTEADHARARYLPAWEVDSEEFHVADGRGRRWLIRLILDDGATVVHTVKPL